MKLLSLLPYLAGAAAQGIGIGFPAPGTVVAAGTPVVVQVIRYNGPLAPTEIGVAIGITACTGSSCPLPTEALGTVLLTLPFQPTDWDHGQLYANFSVTIPNNFNGPARLGVARAFLIGAGPGATWGSASVQVIVAGA